MSNKNIDDQGNRIFPHVSIETNMIVQNVRLLYKEGEQVPISYPEINKWIGKNIQKCRWYLESARNILLREDHIYLETITNVGIRIGTDDDKARGAKDGFSKTSRVMHRSCRIIAAIDYDGLRTFSKEECIAMTSDAGVIDFLSSPSSVKKIAVTGPVETLPVSSVLAMFR